MIMFKFHTSGNVRNKPKDSKNFFKNAFKIILRKNLYLGKISNNIKEKFQFLGIKESLKFASKAVSS